MSCPEEIIYNWYKKGNPRGHLDISQWEMDELPEIPDEVEWLNVSNTTIKHLKGLPKNLKYLYCKYSDIETIETPLPPNLEFIDIRGCENLEPFDIPKHVKVRSNIKIHQEVRKYIKEIKTENHNIVFYRRIKKWIEENQNKKQKTKLDLTLLQIEEYSDIPEDVEWLVCNGNTKIKSLKGLPKALKRLEFQEYPLKEIRDLPPNLEYLNLDCSEIEVLDNLPDTIRKLDITYYSKLNIIKSLPSNLRVLNLKICPNLEEIQCEFPSNLKTIDLTNSRLKYIPKLPETVTKLNLNISCHLLQVPILPKNLKILIITDIYGKIIPNIPDELLHLSIDNISVLDGKPIPNSIVCLSTDDMYIKNKQLRLKINFCR